MRVQVELLRVHISPKSPLLQEIFYRPMDIPVNGAVDSSTPAPPSIQEPVIRNQMPASFTQELRRAGDAHKSKSGIRAKADT